MPKAKPHTFIEGVEHKWCGTGQHYVTVSGYVKCGSAWDGLQSRCRECDAATYRSNKPRRMEQAKRYYQENRQGFLERARRHYQNNRERHKALSQQWVAANREQMQAYYKQYREANKERLRQAGQAYYRENEERIRRNNKEYARANKQTIAERRKEWYLEHKDERRAYHKEWREKNNEVIAEKKKEYWRRHPERVKVGSQARKAREVSAPGKHNGPLLLAKFEFYGWRCYLCGLAGDLKTLDAEHRKPLSRGGSNWPANIAPACRRCNLSKGDKTESEYWRYIRASRLPERHNLPALHPQPPAKDFVEA